MQGFDTKSDEVLLSVHEMPSDSILESFVQDTVVHAFSFRSEYIGRVLAHLGHQPHVRHNLVSVPQFSDRAGHRRYEPAGRLDSERIVQVESLLTADLWL